MKKAFLFSVAALLCLNALSQWTYQTVDNGLDDPYRIAFSKQNNGGYLKLEPMPSVSPCYAIFYITGTYFCDDNPTVNISFLINGEYQKFLIVGEKSSDNKTIFFGSIEGNNNANITTPPGNTIPYNYGSVNFVPYFKAASSIKIRVNESHCDDDYYEFNMSGSTAAYNYITNGCDEWKARIAIEKKEREKQDSIARIQKLQRDSIANAQTKLLDSLMTSNNVIDSVEIKGKYPTLSSKLNVPIYNKPQPFANRIQIGKTIADTLYEWDVLKDAYQPTSPCTVYAISYYDWIDSGHYKRFVEIVSADFKVKGWIDSFFIISLSSLNKYIDDGTIINKSTSTQKPQPRN